MPATSIMPTNFRHHVLTSGNKLTVPELAESYQVTEPTIRSWMRLTGVGKRPTKNGVDKGRIEVMLERGFRAVEIARLMGCSVSSIQKWRKRGQVDGRICREKSQNDPKVAKQRCRTRDTGGVGRDR